MEDEDIIDLAFNIKNDEGLFNLDDEYLEEQIRNIEIKSEKLDNYINERIHPKNRTKLNELIKELENCQSMCRHRENQLHYKSGVIDGFYLAITLTNFK